MVYQPAQPGEAVKKKASKKISEKVFDVMIILFVAVATFALFKLTAVKPENQEQNNPSVMDKISTEDEEEKEVERNFSLSPTINTWLTSLNASVQTGVSTYDIENDKSLGEYNGDERFETASLYKIFPVFEGYRRLTSGAWTETQGSYGGKTVLECLDLAMRESNSGCAENIVSQIGRQELEDMIHGEFLLSNTSIVGMYSTANDIAKFMKVIFKHEGISEAYFARFKDSMLNQPTNDPDGLCGGACNWRGGFPGGFASLSVYNKTGWRHNGAYWEVYNDAAIIEDAVNKRHFVVVAMTRNLSSVEPMKYFGKLVEEALVAEIKEEN